VPGHASRGADVCNGKRLEEDAIRSAAFLDGTCAIQYPPRVLKVPTLASLQSRHLAVGYVLPGVGHHQAEHDVLASK
jgi:hypothetical protein